MISPDTLKFGIWWTSFLVFPFIVWQLWRLRRLWGRQGVTSPVIWLMLSLLFTWTRFIEPQCLQVRETTIASTGIHADIALISDIHLGIYKNNHLLARAVERINTLPVQYVLIAGDFLYQPEADQLDTLLAPLRELKVPVYAVLGNHDQWALGTNVNIDPLLRAALREAGVRIIEGAQIDMGGWRLAGLGDHWSGTDDPAFITHEPSALPMLWLAHNPDSVERLAPDHARLLLAGHTHCGQIRIPWLYRKLIPSNYNLDCGLETARTPHGEVRVFISPGLGEIGLPMRLFNPPTISWLHLRP